MSDTPTADTATTTTTEGTEGEAATASTESPDFSSLAELGLTAEQIKGRLDASRKWEDRSKANAEAAKELDRMKREALPEQERLVAEAEARGAATAAEKYAGRVVDAEVKAAATGRNVDVEALLEGLDRTRFLTPDGEVDSAAIAAWVDRISPKPDADAVTTAGYVDLGQGTRPVGSEALNGDPLLRDLKSKLGIG